VGVDTRIKTGTKVGLIFDLVQEVVRLEEWRSVRQVKELTLN